MQKSYTKNYIKIYFWQGVSLLLNFLSMLVVIPFLTSKPDVYGIYTICISVSIFLTYADLGFINAGQKYAAEHFSRGERDEERKVIGFSGFILLVFLVLFSILFLFLSFNTDFLIKGLEGQTQAIASSLLLVLALFTPVTVLQRLVQMICSIRLEDFIIQRINIIGSLVKISSVFWFFSQGKYDIVGYFVFIQSINLLALLVISYLIKTRYRYDFIKLVKAIRFDKRIFAKTKTLAFTSLFMTAAWILYYELDPVVIGKVLGIREVAIYAIGLTLLTFFRSIFGILFSPFNARFNHFIGSRDTEGLRSFFIQVIGITAPLVVFPIVTIYMFASPLIHSWVGEDYRESVEIAQYLVLCNLFAFITYPTGILLMATEQVKKLYTINALLPFIFWIGIAVSFHFWGLKSFAIFKLTAFGLSALVYYHFMINYLNISLLSSWKLIFKPMVVPVGFIVLATFMLSDVLPVEKSKMNLLTVAFVAALVILIAFIIQYFFSAKWRFYISKLVSRRVS